MDEANRANTLYQGGIATRNEGRQMVGLPPIPGGATFVSNEFNQENQEVKTQNSTPKVEINKSNKKKNSKVTTSNNIATNAIQLSLF